MYATVLGMSEHLTPSALASAEVRAIREKKQIGVGKLAEQLGRERNTVSRKLNGKSELSLNEFFEMTDALGVKASDVMAAIERDHAA